MYLRELLGYDSIVIQCHDLPSVDVIGAGFALYSYYKSHGKNVRLIYSGPLKISRINLKLMIERLHIPLEYVENDFSTDGILVTVGCQYGAANVTKLKAKDVAIIDNHFGYPTSDVSRYKIACEIGSCSAMVYQMLLSEKVFHLTNKDESVGVTNNLSVTTALYYGVYMATNEFSDITYISDREVRDEVEYDEEIFKELQYSSLSVGELRVVGMALANYRYDEKNKFAVSYVKDCEPSVIGQIADIMNRVYDIECCVVIADLDDMYKLSVRSSIKEVKASEFFDYAALMIGQGSGTPRKAGGLIYKDLFTSANPNKSIADFIYEKFATYRESCECIYVSEFDFETEKSDFQKYIKKNILHGFVRTTELISEGASLILRTREGEVTVTADPNIYVMIGMDGEVYPITKEKFEMSYKESEEPASFDYEYEPRVYNSVTGEVRLLKPYIRVCRVLSRMPIWAKVLKKPTKLFSDHWNYTNYMFALEGDVLAVRLEDRSDMYIIKKGIFERLYEICEDKKLPNELFK